MADRYTDDDRYEKVINDIRNGFCSSDKKITDDMMDDKFIIWVMEQTANVYRMRWGYKNYGVIECYADGVGFNEYAKQEGIHPSTARTRYKVGINNIRRGILDGFNVLKNLPISNPSEAIKRDLLTPRLSDEESNLEVLLKCNESILALEELGYVIYVRNGKFTVEMDDIKITITNSTNDIDVLGRIFV